MAARLGLGFDPGGAQLLLRGVSPKNAANTLVLRNTVKIHIDPGGRVRSSAPRRGVGGALRANPDAAAPLANRTPHLPLLRSLWLGNLPPIEFWNESPPCPSLIDRSRAPVATSAMHACDVRVIMLLPLTIRLHARANEPLDKQASTHEVSEICPGSWGISCASHSADEFERAQAEGKLSRPCPYPTGSY